MFQFPRFPSYTYVFSIWYTVLHRMCFHIQKSADRGLFAAPRSLSQVITSFIGSQCQGIHLTLFFAWTAVLFSINLILGNKFSFFAWASQIIVFLPLINFNFFGKTNLISNFVFFPVRYQFLRINSLLFSVFRVLINLFFLYSVFNEHFLNLILH